MFKKHIGFLICNRFGKDLGTQNRPKIKQKNNKKYIYIYIYIYYVVPEKILLTYVRRYVRRVCEEGM